MNNLSSDPELELVLRDLKQSLHNLYGERLVGVLLFGSQARRQAGPGSDIDVLLILQGEVHPSKEIDRLEGILADLNLEYGVLVSVLPVSRHIYEEADGPFWRQVRTEGIIVSSEEVEALLSQAEDFLAEARRWLSCDARE